jgi:hypothetical protein
MLKGFETGAMTYGAVRAVKPGPAPEPEADGAARR